MELLGISLESTSTAVSSAAQQQQQFRIAKIVRGFGQRMSPRGICLHSTHFLCYGSIRWRGTRVLMVVGTVS